MRIELTKSMKKRLLLIVISVMISPQAYPQTIFDYPQPNQVSTLTKMTLWATQYYIHKFQSKGNIPIMYQDGMPSGLRADTCDFCEASLEGTAYVTDSTGAITVINYAATGEQTFVDCRACKKYANSKLKVENWGKVLWKKSSGFGDGVRNYKLIPFRTIAVDSKIIPYGTVIFIPAAKGKIIELSNGSKTTHDGYFFAGDTGGAIKNNHIDVFTGIFSKNPFPEMVKSNELKTFEAYVITDQIIIQSLLATHTQP
jgi:3D (Asp-Asp-Asp) domain-containing protein